MPQRDTGDFTGFACDTCNQKFDDDHGLKEHKRTKHADAKAFVQNQGSQQGSDTRTNPADKKPGIEPADHNKTTELPPGAEKARAGRN
jgi:hypothetical protein